MVTVLARPGICVGLSLWLLAAVIWKLALPQPPHAVAQAVPVPVASENGYWGGFVLTGKTSYTAVRATWVVPAVHCSPSRANSTVYIWIGEGGYVRGISSPLIQVGTASDCLGGHVRYHAFYEWYPGIYATDFPLNVAPGDTVAASASESMPDHWALRFSDLPSHTTKSVAIQYSVDTSSAEFVVERPTVCGPSGCGQVGLGRFRTVTFEDAHAEGTGLFPDDGKPGVTPLALVDAARHRLAIPARRRNSSASFSVLWRGEF